MKEYLQKYAGVIPAFYACYDDAGSISRERSRKFARHLKNKGVKGLYVGGSSGECIYLEKEERMQMLEAVMEEVGGEMTVIAHVACNNTAESCELARHANALKVDAVASIPPIYFHLPDYAIKEYWLDIKRAAPDCDFIMYNIPQLAGVALSVSLYKEMLQHDRVIGVKNSSLPVQDIQRFKAEGGENCVVFNGPDEQFLAGRAIGADGGIGGTYGVMPELFLLLDRLFKEGDMQKAQRVQHAINAIICRMFSCHGNLYAVMKKIIELKDGLFLGSVRKPLPPLIQSDMPCVLEAKEMIERAQEEFLT